LALSKVVVRIGKVVCAKRPEHIDTNEIAVSNRLEFFAFVGKAL